ncbi:hypothetical protein N781_13215 [Pontibacillus halophilus JSM 076056 = DSM 19796]|uniref:STAS domain-containing protein n=1 Tax=Pontibacillus halophilus JSM 076056 = DSM 19796 TaxID=1385510 RepID=A0A0A5GP93_9BACI|nr:STAS domain-containing protein [Pontibacillus halophilus]KGX93038.1 hypothetical protein N781_13215 [Pontibacillus halophilus JSM 076056 = DSM 19796]
MQLVYNQFPLPIFVIDKRYHILYATEEAEREYTIHSSLLDFIDEGSLEKVKQWVSPDKGKQQFEIHVLNRHHNLVLVDAYVYWQNDLHAEIMFIQKDEQVSRVTEVLQRLQQRLNDTNFELLQKKEELEESLLHNYKLSAPFIGLSEGNALVSLYGELTEEKLQIVEESILKAAHESNADRLLIDFTAVGKIEDNGVQALHHLLLSLEYMGKELIVIGIRPQQARLLHKLKATMSVRYMNSLQQAITVFIK